MCSFAKELIPIVIYPDPVLIYPNSPIFINAPGDMMPADLKKLLEIEKKFPKHLSKITLDKRFLRAEKLFASLLLLAKNILDIDRELINNRKTKQYNLVNDKVKKIQLRKLIRGKDYTVLLFKLSDGKSVIYHFDSSNQLKTIKIFFTQKHNRVYELRLYSRDDYMLLYKNNSAQIELLTYNHSSLNRTLSYSGSMLMARLNTNSEIVYQEEFFNHTLKNNLGTLLMYKCHRSVGQVQIITIHTKQTTAISQITPSPYYIWYRKNMHSKNKISANNSKLLVFKYQDNSTLEILKNNGYPDILIRRDSLNNIIRIEIPDKRKASHDFKLDDIELEMYLSFYRQNDHYKPIYFRDEYISIFTDRSKGVIQTWESSDKNDSVQYKKQTMNL